MDFKSLDHNHKHALACTAMMIELLLTDLEHEVDADREEIRDVTTKKAIEIVNEKISSEGWESVEKIVNKWDDFLNLRRTN